MLNRSLGIVLAGLALAHCGQDSRISSSKLASGATHLEASNMTHLRGIDDRGDECLVALRLDSDVKLVSVTLSGTFTVDYKIPAPLSGIYGVQRIPGVFDSSINLAPGAAKIGKPWFSNDTALSGTGKPLFWETPEALHHITIKGRLNSPSSVVYRSTTKIAGLLPFVTIDLDCHQLSRAQ